MASERKERTFLFDLLGKNYFSWKFQFEMYVNGKGKFGHLNGALKDPSDKVVLDTWETKGSQIIYYILASIESQIVNNRCSFSTAKAMWDHLKIICDQNNAAKGFQLELDIYIKRSLVSMFMSLYASTKWHCRMQNQHLLDVMCSLILVAFTPL